MKPGNTIWLKGGTYKGVFNSQLRGTLAAPIIVRAVRGERVIIDLNNGVNNNNRAFAINGAYTWFWDLEFTDSHPVRSTTQSGSHPTDVPRGYSSISIFGPGIKVINSVAHDIGVGVRDQSTTSTDSEVYGSILFNNGFHGSDRGHGQGIYIQNVTGTKRIRETIAFNNFHHGIQAYAESSSVNNLLFEGFIGFNNGSLEALIPGEEAIRRQENLLIGTTTYPTNNIKVLSSHLHLPEGTYTSNLRLGYQAAGTNSEVADSVFSGGYRGIQISRQSNFSVKRNTFVRYRDKYARPMFLDFIGTAAPGIDNNRYYDALPNTDGQAFGFSSVVQSITGWRTRGFDLNSTYQVGKPANQVFVRPNAYEPGRAHIVVYNWTGASSVSVNLNTTGLALGDAFEIRDVQNLFGAPVFSGTYNGNAISLSLANRVVAAPIGMTQSPTHTGPNFFTFLVIRK